MYANHKPVMGHGTATWGRLLAAAMAGALLPIVSDVAQGQANAPAFAQATAGEQRVPKTVLDGVFTAAQAERGAAVYFARCSACHEGADVDGPPLTGAPFLDRWREDTLDGLFEFIKTEMPQSTPGSLSDAAYLDIVAHLLHENDFPAGPFELTMGLVNSTLVVGPNGPQPLPLWRAGRGRGCLTQSPSREWIVARADRSCTCASRD